MRAHKAGDHSLCKRCPAVTGKRAPLAAVPALPASGESRQPLNAKEELEDLARTLRAAHEADTTNAPLARELRMTLQALLDADRKPAGDEELAGLFAAFGAS